MTSKIELDEKFIVENYHRLPTKDIAKLLNVKPYLINRRAVVLGLGHKEKYTYNIDYFKNWSHDMAYILGFIFADGCIKFGARNSCTLSFGNKTEDKSVLEFISSKLGTNLKVNDYSQFDKRTLQTYYSSRLNVNCREIVDDLITLNICERKTGKEKLPEIPEEYKHSFLCGYHDGDGHLRDGNNSSYQYSFEFPCMNEQFLLDIQNKICDGLGKVSLRRGLYEYHIYGRDICKELDKKMTQNVSFYLKRKHFQ